MPTLAVTPDGSAVYFTTTRRPAPNECPFGNAGRVEQMARVPIGGGPVTEIAPGVFPAVSPNGRLLAYTRNATNPCNPDYNELVLDDLSSGEQRTFTSARGVYLGFLSWAPDSAHLAYTDGGGQPLSAELLDTATARTLDDARPIAHDANAAWGGFLGITGDAIGVTPAASVVELGATRGDVARTLFTIPGGLEFSNRNDGPGDALHADRSGRYVLAVGSLGGHGALYRWHDGDPGPTLIGEEIWAAVWIEPTSAPAPSTATISTLPTATSPMTASPGTTTALFPVNGVVELNDHNPVYLAGTDGQPCVAKEEYAYLHASATLTVTNDAGVTVASTVIGPGTLQRNACVFPFRLANLPTSASYTFTIAGGKSLSATREYIRAARPNFVFYVGACC